MTQGEIIVERVSLDDLYHPHTLDHYDPDCCCAYCLDVSIAKARREQAAMYRDMRRKGQGKMARLLWRKIRSAEKAYLNSMADALFRAPLDGPQYGGLQVLLWDGE